MELAQAKAINSFSFRDITNTLTEQWAYCYEKIAQVDAGFYSTTIPITQKLTHLPPLLKQSILVYASIDPVGYSRKVYKEASNNDLNSPWTYRISGNDMYCWDAPTRKVWLEYVPEPPFLTFTKNNRDYRILDNVPDKQADNYNYGMFELINESNVDIASQEHYIFRPRGSVDSSEETDLTEGIQRPDHTLRTFILDYPYAFASYEHNQTHEFSSFILKDILNRFFKDRYNPFDYMGRTSSIEYLSVKYNDYTGLSAVILDHNDGLAKELGWTPDTLVTYPSNVIVNYLRANIAKRFASLNNSTIMAVEDALVSSANEMSKFLKRDQSAWSRMNNVTGPTWADFI